MSFQDYGDNMLNISYDQSILNSSVNKKKESLIKKKVSAIVKMRKQYSNGSKDSVVIESPDEYEKNARR